MIDVTNLPHLILDGEWQIEFDAKNVGKRQSWFAPGNKIFSYNINVPGVWNEINPDCEGVAWYQRKFIVGPEWENLEAELHFGAVDYFAEVWLNGHYLCSHEGGHTPFVSQVGKSLRQGENALVVRVVDPPSSDINLEVDGFRMIEIPCGKQHWYHNFSGIWQSVSLRGTGSVWLDNLFVQPDLRHGAADVLVDVSSKKKTKVTLEFIITRADNGQTVITTSQSFTLKSLCHRIRKILRFPVEPVFWTIENPFLYRMTIKAFVSGELSDRVSACFGMREFTINGQRFLLNGEPIRLRGFLNQQWYPVKLAFPADEDACRKEMQMVKDANCNFVRMHIRPALPRLLDLADEMGLLIYEEPAIGWISYSSQVKKRCLTEIKEMVLRDRNHPSVVIWGIFNEGGCRGKATKEGYSPTWHREAKSVRDFDESLVECIQSLDPTRPTILDSGGLEWNLYFNGADPKAHRLFDYHAYRPVPTPDNVRFKFRRYGNSRQLLFVSEYGCGGYPDVEKVVAQYGNPTVEYCDLREYQRLLEHTREFYLRELKDVFPNLKEAIAAIQEFQAENVKIHTENLRANPYCQGFAICQQNDAGPECEAGVADIWRNPRPSLSSMAHACQPLYPALDTERHNLYPGEIAHIEVNIINDTCQNKRVTLSLEVSDRDGKFIVSRERVEIPVASVKRCDFAITVPSKSGPVELKAILLENQKVISQNILTLHVIAPSKLHISGPITLVDFANHCTAEMTLWRFLASIGAVVERYPGFLDARLSGSIGNLILFSSIQNLRDLMDEGVAKALEKVRSGGVGIILGLPFGEETAPSGLIRNRCFCQVNNFPSKPFGVPIKYVNSEGNAFGFFHYVKRYPVFKGLPASCIMGDIYANVCPTKSLYLPGVETIAGCFAPPVLYHANARHHPDVPEWREGQDLCTMSYGKGILIFSQFRIVENLGSDPISETLLVNLINWAMTLTGKPRVSLRAYHGEFLERINNKRLGER